MNCPTHGLADTDSKPCWKCKETFEAQEAVNVVSRYVNYMSRDSTQFSERMTNEHRTLQQSFFRLMMRHIQYVADMPDNKIDGRNEYSRTLAREIVAKVENLYIPMV